MNRINSRRISMEEYYLVQWSYSDMLSELSGFINIQHWRAIRGMIYDKIVLHDNMMGMSMVLRPEINDELKGGR